MVSGVFKSDSRHTGSIETDSVSVSVLSRLISTCRDSSLPTLENKKCIYFRWNILDTYEILRGRVTIRVVNSNSRHTKLDRRVCGYRDGFHLPCAIKYSCVFAPLFVCFFINYSWHPICGVKEASGEKNFTHFFLGYVWGDGKYILFAVGAMRSWIIIHDLPTAGFWSVE